MAIDHRKLRELMDRQAVSLDDLVEMTKIDRKQLFGIIDGSQQVLGGQLQTRIEEAMGASLGATYTEPSTTNGASKPPPEAESKFARAIIFTHFHGLKYPAPKRSKSPGIKPFDEKRKEAYIQKYSQLMQSYMQCNADRKRISIVYGYVDWAVKQEVRELTKRVESNRKSDLFVSMNVLDEEEELISILKEAETEAKLACKLSNDRQIKFIFIGFSELRSLLGYLIRLDHPLINFLFGRSKSLFGYDSPKFVEAIIRLARGDIPKLVNEPVIRIDDDARPTPNAIDQLLRSYKEISAKKAIFFFSGRYGNENGTEDPINNYAVRSAWFYPVGTQIGKTRSTGEKKAYDRGYRWMSVFFSDLARLGATEIKGPHDNHQSKTMKNLIARKDPGLAAPRSSVQVVSGAGLVMSRRAIDFLPPFMCFDSLTTWVDDHLKRLLHEAIGDIDVNDQECVTDCWIVQDRHPGGVPKDASEWHKEKYFKRLLSGCLVNASIMDADGGPTIYSDTIRSIGLFIKVDRSAKAIRKLKSDTRARIRGRLELVLECWSAKELRGSVVWEWAKEKSASTSWKNKCCRSVLEDLIRYMELVERWPAFVRAITRLGFDDEWLYESPD